MGFSKCKQSVCEYVICFCFWEILNISPKALLLNVLISTPDSPHFYYMYMYGANLGLFLYGDVPVIETDFTSTSVKCQMQIYID